METILSFTAWPMARPNPYSPFHIIAALIGILLSLYSARVLAKKTSFEKSSSSVLFCCGLVLAACELYKQAFLYFIVNSKSFDWWYFPFQLCSIPMYLCLLYPVVSSSYLRQILLTFLQDFGILGGIMALVEPSGLMHPYWTLTLHGFLWHFILIFLGLYCCFGRTLKPSLIEFLRTLPLFFLCCLIATIINVSVGPEGNADMFYISPYYPCLQIVFHEISLHVGIIPGNLIYLFSIPLGAGIIHYILWIAMRPTARQ
ncbi:hypothetical protein AALB16_00825 [Lachnospiraceae bacterium 62-35]